MKTPQLQLFIIAILLTFLGCNDKAKEAETKEAQSTATSNASTEVFKTDISKSTIEWKGFKPTGSHYGTISISEGTFEVDNGMIKSGTFAIDMNSITVTDIPVEDDGNADLTSHLKSNDFFDVETYPTAKLEITGMASVNGKMVLSGNLSMKDATNNISIPVNTSVNGNQMTLTSKAFTIDRTKWNIKYKSKSFFGDLKDKFIHDEIELKVNLVALKV